MMQRISLVEKVGSGISRIRDTMTEANLPAPKFQMGGFFTVTFYRPVLFAVWIKGWEALLPPPVVNVLVAIHQNENVTKPQISALVKQGKTSVDKHISTLRHLGLIERLGSKKTGVWKVHQLPPSSAGVGDKVGDKFKNMGLEV